MAYFGEDLWTMARAALRGVADGRPWEKQEARLAWYILIGTLPIGVCGLLFQRFIVGSSGPCTSSRGA